MQAKINNCELSSSFLDTWVTLTIVYRTWKPVTLQESSSLGVRISGVNAYIVKSTHIGIAHVEDGFSNIIEEQ